MMQHDDHEDVHHEDVPYELEQHFEDHSTAPLYEPHLAEHQWAMAYGDMHPT